MGIIQLHTPIPGPNSRALVARREAATPRGAAKLTPLAIVRAHGAALHDADGNTLLDFAGGIGALAVGHTPSHIVDAIQAQAAELLHLCAIVGSYEPMVRVAELLNAHTPGDFAKKTVLLNSGAEAVETAVKICRAATGRAAVVVFEGAYHGRTNLTLAMTSKYGLFKKGFGPFAPEVYRLPFPDVFRRPAGMSADAAVDMCIAAFDHAMIAQVDASAIACVVIEPVQGEGGFRPVPPRYMAHLRAVCDAHGIVLVADEIQSGFGRTGKLFACEHDGVVPDLLISGKSLAAGLPLAAVTGRADLMDAPTPGGLGGTYSANPLACAAAVEAIQTIADPAFLARATALGARLRARLEALAAQHPAIGDVRGVGPMLALELVRPDGSPDADAVQRVLAAALVRGLVILRAGITSNCIRFLPPLNIDDAVLDEGLDVLAAALAEALPAAQPA